MIEGLWALKIGNGMQSDEDDIYFSAGISDGHGGPIEEHGLFGEIEFSTPDGGSSTGALLGVALAGIAASRRRV